MINLREIIEDIFDDCINLEVTDKQNNYVASNLYSLAQAWLHDETARPFCIYKDDIMIGFVMLEYDEPEKECGIWRLMIDKKYQGKGYGKEAMRVILDYIKSNPIFEVIHLSTMPHNESAVKLVNSFGFSETGEIDEDGEITMILKLR